MKFSNACRSPVKVTLFVHRVHEPRPHRDCWTHAAKRTLRGALRCSTCWMSYTVHTESLGARPVKRCRLYLPVGSTQCLTASIPHWWGTANPAARVPHTRAARTIRPYQPPGHVSVGFVCEYQPDRAKIDLVRAHGAGRRRARRAQRERHDAHDRRVVRVAPAMGGSRGAPRATMRFQAVPVRSTSGAVATQRFRCVKINNQAFRAAAEKFFRRACARRCGTARRR